MRGDSAVQTTVLFGFIALVLCGLAIGGVWVIKARNSSYAKNQQPIAVQETSQNQNSATSSEAVDDQGAQVVSDAAKNSETTQTESPAAQSENVADNLVVAETGPQTMPATGGSADFAITSVLVMLSVFFCARLWQAKVSLRRLYDAS